MNKHSNRFLFVFIFIFCCVSFSSYAEKNEERVAVPSPSPIPELQLRQKRGIEGPNTPFRSQNKRRKSALPVKVKQEEEESSSFKLATLVSTPLGSTNLFDERFQSIGLGILFSYAFLDFEKDMKLLFETGSHITYSRLSLNLPAITFSHFTFQFPVRLRLDWAFNPNWAVYVVGGIHLRLFEYDSRNTTDGGFHGVTNLNKVEPDGALGLLYTLSDGFFLRLEAGFQLLALGLEFGF